MSNIDNEHSIGPNRCSGVPLCITWKDLADILWRDIGLLEARLAALEPEPVCPTCNGKGMTIHFEKLGIGGELRDCPDCDGPVTVFDNSFDPSK